MTTAKDVLDAVNRLLVKRWPTRTVYRDDVPKDFDRPSFLLEVVKENRATANVGLIKVSSYFTITAFEPTDEYGDMAASSLLDTQIAVMELLESGTLAVNDRCIQITASYGGNNEGEAYVDLQCEYLDARTTKPTSLPPMGKVSTNIKLEG